MMLVTDISAKTTFRNLRTRHPNDIKWHFIGHLQSSKSNKLIRDVPNLYIGTLESCIVATTLPCVLSELNIIDCNSVLLKKRMSNKELYQSLGLFLLGIAFPFVHGYVFPKAAKNLKPSLLDLHESLRLDPSIQLTPFEKSLGIATRDAAWKAGEIIRDALGTINVENGVESKIGSRDIVTKIDKEAQEIIRDVILSYFPDHKFLGEEDIPPGIEASRAAMEARKDDQHLWIVDPVDGTTNFAHGMPLCAVIICYASYGEVLHGFIYDPFRDESFYAWKGKGAYMNGQRLHCCHAETLSTSVVITGSPPNIPSLNACLRGLVHLSPLVRSMRCLGSAAFCLSWTALGRLTAYFEADLNAWDVAAGALLIQEAGGRVTDVWGQDFRLTTRNIVAANKHIHAVLLQELQTARMWIDEKEDDETA